MMNPRLIRLLASQYRDLQGLRTIIDALWPIAFAALIALARSNWDLLLALPTAGVWLWYRLTWVSERIELFYETRCGRVASRSRMWPYALVFAQFVTLGAGHTVMVWPPFVRVTFLLVALTAYPVLALIRDAPYRSHWVLPLLVGVGAAVQNAGLTSTSQADIWAVRVLLLGAVAMVLAGFGDHVLLMRAAAPAGARETSGERP